MDIKDKKNSEFLRELLLLGCIVIVYFISGKLGLKLAFLNSSASAVWPPTGISLAVFLLFGFRVWPAIFIGAYLVNITTTPSIPASLLIALGNTLEGVVGSYLILRFAGGARFFARALNIFKYALFAAGFAPAISATIGVTSLILFGFAQTHEFIPVWLTWWLGDLTGAVIITPFILVLLKPTSHIRWNRQMILELIFLFLSLILLSLCVFGEFSHTLERYPLDFLVFPFVVWIAFRFSLRETVVSTIILSILAIYGTLHGYGPFVRSSPNESLLMLQIFMSIVSLTGLSVGALVSERRASEEIVKNNEERYRTLVNMAPDVIYGLSADGKFTDLNPAFEKITGWNVSEWIGRPFIELIHPQDLPAALEKFKHGLEGEKTLNFELRIATKSGKYLIGAFSSVPKIEEGKIVGKFGIARDVTGEKEIEKMKTDFFTITAHQLRTPLTHIRWNIEMLFRKNKNSLSESLSKALDQIYNDDKRMIEMINKLMKIVRFEQGQLPNKPEEVDVVKTVEKISKEHESEAKIKSITLQIQVLKKPVRTIFVDQERFSDVIENLISNAIKYSNKGKVVITIDSAKENLHISVSDTGIGIPKNDQAKIFSQFFRAENAILQKTEGTGLGLHLAKTYVENWGGTIGFESAENKGSTFSLSIPFKPNAAS